MESVIMSNCEKEKNIDTMASNFKLIPEDDSPYWLIKPLEVKVLLKQIERQGLSVELTVHTETELLRFDTLIIKNESLLIVDLPNNSEIVSKLKKGMTVKLRVDLNGADIYCESIISDIQNDLQIELPKKIHKLQRREFYRVITPPVKQPRLIISNADGVSEFKIFDISLGGVGIIADSAQFIKVNSTIQNCELNLNEFGSVFVTIEVRYIFDVALPDKKMGKKIGIKFKKLRSSDETIVQKYLHKIENLVRS